MFLACTRGSFRPEAAITVVASRVSRTTFGSWGFSFSRWVICEGRSFIAYAQVLFSPLQRRRSLGPGRR